MRLGVLSHTVILLALLVPAAAAAAQDANALGKIIMQIEFLDQDTQWLLAHARYYDCTGLVEGRDRLTRTGLKAAVQALFDTGSFSDVAVTAVPHGSDIKLRFHLRLSTYFNRFFLTKGIDLGGKSAADAIGLPVGVRFSEGALEEARRAVQQYMIGQGYYLAEVSARWARDGDSNRIDCAFDIRPGLQAIIRSAVIHGVPPGEMAEIREKLGLKEGRRYRRDRFLRRMEQLKRSLVDRGFLDAELHLQGDPETFRAGDNSIALDLSVANFGQVRIEVDGFKIPKEQQRRLLPVLAGAGLRPELVAEGSANLEQYLEERGYPEAAVSTPDPAGPDDAGVRRLRYVVDRGPRVQVSEVQFRGNRAFSSEELLRVLQMQPARSWQRLAFGVTRIDSFLQRSTYSIPKLDADVDVLRALYASAGYLHAVILPMPEFDAAGETVRLTFDCTEGPRALCGQVTINGAPPVQVLMAKLGLDPAAAQALAGKMSLVAGRPYSSNLIKHDRQVLLAAFNDAGYLQALVNSPKEETSGSNGFDVDFEVREGTRTLIDRVIVVGRNRTRNSVVEKHIELKPDEPLSLGQMLETQQALYGTGVFDLVRVEPQNPTSEVPRQNVVVRLQEAKPRTLRYGLGYQEREKVRGILEISDLNILGFGQSAILRLRGSSTQQAGAISFKQPQIKFLPVDSYLTFSGSKKKQISFTERRLDLSYQYSRPINNHTWSLLRYSFTKVRVSQVTPDLAREEMPRYLSTISAYYINDTRDNYTDTNARYLDPQKGFFTSTNGGFTVNHGGEGYYLSLYSQNRQQASDGLLAPCRVAASDRWRSDNPRRGEGPYQRAVFRRRQLQPPRIRDRPGRPARRTQRTHRRQCPPDRQSGAERSFALPDRTHWNLRYRQCLFASERGPVF
jgi:outer membrane protein assembly factor BamA